MTILIGADPEVFVQDRSTKETIAAEGLVTGTKEEPTPVDCGGVQVDGMALEFNIDPARTQEEFLHNIQHVKEQLHQMIGAQDYDLLINPTAVFSDDVWWGCSHEAKTLGCSPDLNAWTGKYNKLTKPDGFFRTAAGHIHVGFSENENVKDKSYITKCAILARQLDTSLGVQSILWDDDTERRSLYGAAGAFRPKPYGMEYRVLSNAWLKTEELIRHVYDVAHKATVDLQGGIDYLKGIDPEEVVAIINESRVPTARRLSDQLYGNFGVPVV